MLNNFIQAEKFYTVNFFEQPRLGGWNLIPILWVILMLIWLGFYLSHINADGDKQTFTKKAWWLLFLFWLPIALSSWLSLGNFWLTASRNFNQPVDDQRQARLCVLDANQKFNGAFCAIGQTIQAVKKNADQPASICFLAGTEPKIFLTYGLYQKFDLPIDCQKADYLLVFASLDRVIYTPEKHVVYSIKNETDSKISSTDLGVFDSPQTLSPKVFLLKRSK